MFHGLSQPGAPGVSTFKSDITQLPFRKVVPGSTPTTSGQTHQCPYTHRDTTYYQRIFSLLTQKGKIGITIEHLFFHVERSLPTHFSSGLLKTDFREFLGLKNISFSSLSLRRAGRADSLLRPEAPLSKCKQF